MLELDVTAIALNFAVLGGGCFGVLALVAAAVWVLRRR